MSRGEDIHSLARPQYTANRRGWLNKGKAVSNTKPGHFSNGILLRSTALPSSQKKSIKIGRHFNLGSMIQHGKFNHVNSDVIQKHFPCLGNIHGEFEYKLFCFSGNVSSEFANAAIVKAGTARPWEWAYGEHLLVFGIENPESQRKYPIVALNAVGSINGNVQVMCLFGSASYRSLDLAQWNGLWENCCQFLAVRKCRAARSNSRNNRKKQVSLACSNS